LAAREATNRTALRIRLARCAFTVALSLATSLSTAGTLTPTSRHPMTNPAPSAGALTVRQQTAHLRLDHRKYSLAVAADGAQVTQWTQFVVALQAELRLAEHGTVHLDVQLNGHGPGSCVGNADPHRSRIPTGFKAIRNKNKPHSACSSASH
jgi:hypothetical protein